MNSPKLLLQFYGFFLTITTLNCCLCIASSSNCFETERLALVQFKQHLTDPSNRLSSWIGQDCCRWSGIVCNNFTGHVTKIKLANPYNDVATDLFYENYQQHQLGGKINPSLLNLEHLRHLDLSFNNFNYSPIPSFIGSITSLTYLNLSSSRFGGKIPHQLGNLTKIRHFDLGGIFFNDILNRLSSDNLQWVTDLVSLRYIDMSWVNLRQAIDWVHVTSMLPSLLELRLPYCWLSDISPSIKNINFTSLSVLDLSYNEFNSAAPWWVFTLPRLVSLNIGGDSFIGSPLPSFLQNMTSLKVFRNSGNYLHSDTWMIPNWFYSLTQLEVIDLSGNSLQGVIKNEIGNLTSLISLNLGGNQLKGGIPLSLGKLGNLRELVLSYNQLAEIDIGKFLKSFLFQKLEMLELGSCNVTGHLPYELSNFKNLANLFFRGNSISGPIPHSIGRLSNLEFLDLSSNSISDPIPPSIGRLSNLKELDLSDNSISGPIPHSIGILSNLVFLGLSSNSISGPIPDSIGRLSNLKYLYLSDNSISSPIPPSIGRLSNLKQLDLSNNSISGPIPPSIGRLSNLKYLFLSSNSISGPIPHSIGRLSNLEYLVLSHNQLNGTLPLSLGQLTMLDDLSLHNNLLEGVVTDLHFANLTRLKNLDGSGNKLSWKSSDDWFPPFQLLELILSNWQLGPRFPSWLQHQNQLNKLEMASTGISDCIPTWFGNRFKDFEYLNLSSNKIYGGFPNDGNKYGRKESPDIFPKIDLSSNNFTGPLPALDTIPNVSMLDLSRNSFSGSVHRFLCNEDGVKAVYIDFGYNLLSGSIPDCLDRWESLAVLKLNNNYLNGTIPNSIRHLKNLASLHLRNNHISGELPRSLQYNNNLRTVDLSWNQLTGKIPTWVGTNLSQIAYLNLHSNRFHGVIPNEFCHLQSLQILDLAQNNLSGLVPTCFSNFSAMIKATGNEYWNEQVNLSLSSISGETIEVTENGFFVIKGREYEYSSTIKLVTMMDLSSNNFSGRIPEELTRLVGLRFLNLSTNHFSGIIPVNIGKMGLLESLDLSRNHLSGNIPESMSSMTSLSKLDVSHNNLNGQIPTSTQLQSLNESGFAYNKLCGPPLPKCNTNRTVPEVVFGNEKEDDDYWDLWFIGSIALGFIVSFWVVMGPLIVSTSWRTTYFGALDSVWYKLCGFVIRCRRFFSHN